MKLIKYVSVAAFAPPVLAIWDPRSAEDAVYCCSIPVDSSANVEQGLIRVESYWNEDRKEHIRHAYWILRRGRIVITTGHKAAAMEQLKKSRRHHRHENSMKAAVTAVKDKSGPTNNFGKRSG